MHFDYLGVFCLCSCSRRIFSSRVPSWLSFSARRFWASGFGVSRFSVYSFWIYIKSYLLCVQPYKKTTREKDKYFKSIKCLTISMFDNFLAKLNYLKLGQGRPLIAHFLFASIFWLSSFLQTLACAFRVLPFARPSDQSCFLSVFRRQYFPRVCSLNCAAAVCSFCRLQFCPRWDSFCDRFAPVFLFAWCVVLHRGASYAPLFVSHRDLVASSSSWP